MEDYNSNDNYNQMEQPRKKRRGLKIFAMFLVLLFAFSAWGASQFFSKANQIFTNERGVFGRLGQLFISDDSQLIGENKGKVNVLLLGMGGEGHEGPLLTDTFIVAQIDVKINEVVLISIPRDFTIQAGTGFQKINSAYAYAQAASGKGGEAAIAAAEKVTGFEIPYYASIDFKGFIEAVDHVGGLNIEVERTFTDSFYPDNRFGYLSPVTFTKGSEHMSGVRALQFARSRQGNNGEGSDFARSERQKKIITAFADKVVKLDLTDIKTINNLLNDFTENFRTNLELHELRRLGEIAKKISEDKVYSFSLHPEGVLICEGIIEDYTMRAYVIQPCDDKTYQDIHEYLANSLNLAKLQKEGATIEVQNSTGEQKALQAIKALNLLDNNLKITTFKSRTPYERTIIYDNSENSKPNTLEYLRDNLAFTFADIPYTNSDADFIIVLGKDAL